MDELCTDIEGWQLAAMSVGALAAAVAALALYELAPAALQALLHASADESRGWRRLAVGTAMGVGAAFGFARAYATVVRYGERSERQGRRRKLAAFLVGTVPWVGFVLWLWWESR